MSDDFRRALDAHRAGDLEQAVALYRAALPHEPSHGSHNLAVALASLGRFDEAETFFRRAIELEPRLPHTRHSLAMLLLGQGRYEEGWPLFEARRRIPGKKTPDFSARFPEWRGEDLAGRRLLVAWEQGFGDQIQFARFLPALGDAGAEVTFLCAPELVSLFPGAAAAVANPRFDYWIPLCSLPHRLGVTLETIPAPTAIDVQGPGGGGVGVVARGAPSHANDANRSLGGADAARLLALGRDLAPAATGAQDFRQTAEIVSGLDLVICVDTSVAHLAASLGKPTWILLPDRDTDWRWLRGRSDSPWYPSARLFRQARPGDWSGVLDRVEAELAQLRAPA